MRLPAVALPAAAALAAACGTGERPEAAGGDRLGEPPPAEEPVEVIDPVPGAVRTACAVVARYWNGHPGATVRAFDSLVTAPGDGSSLRDACFVQVAMDELRDPDVEQRTPLAASGWFGVYEFDADAPLVRVRVYQNDPVRCRVEDVWDAGFVRDTTPASPPGFRQLTACWRRTPLG